MSEFVHLSYLDLHPDCSDATRKAAEDWLEDFQMDCNRQHIGMTYPHVSVDTLGCVVFTWTYKTGRKLEITIGGLLVTYRRDWEIENPLEEQAQKGRARYYMGYGNAGDLETCRLLWAWYVS